MAFCETNTIFRRCTGYAALCRANEGGTASNHEVAGEGLRAPRHPTESQRITSMTNIPQSLMRAMIIMPFLSIVAQPGHAGTPQMRTYVSGLGSDSNPCTASLPCRSFSAALAATIAGGEIYVLNSANYGSVVINKAVTITSEGAVAGVLATSGVGITVSAGPGNVINLRGLDIDGGSSGNIGIQFISGQALNIQKSTVRGFAGSGIAFSPSGTASIFVSDSTVTNNRSNGILVTGAVNGALNRITASGNGVGIFASGAGVNLTLSDIVTSSNNYGIGAHGSAMMVRNATISSNAVGVAADQAAIVRVSQSTVTANGTGLQATSGGQVVSFGNNDISGNNTDGVATSTVALQ